MTPSVLPHGLTVTSTRPESAGVFSGAEQSIVRWCDLGVFAFEMIALQNISPRTINRSRVQLKAHRSAADAQKSCEMTDDAASCFQGWCRTGCRKTTNYQRIKSNEWELYERTVTDHQLTVKN